MNWWISEAFCDKICDRADKRDKRHVDAKPNPAAGFVDYFKGKNLVVINKSETAKAVRANLSIAGPIGEISGQIEV